jgi:hypothetical protein
LEVDNLQREHPRSTIVASIVHEQYERHPFDLPFQGEEEKQEQAALQGERFASPTQQSLAWPAAHVDDGEYACDNIFCYTPLLQKTLEVGIKRDWRAMKLRRPSEEARREFDALLNRTMDNPSKMDIEVYTATFFEAADDVFVPSKPVDWTPR